MKPFHYACKSHKLETKKIVTGRGKETTMTFCAHCRKLIENNEVIKTDRRLASVVTYEGRAYSYGRECK